MSMFKSDGLFGNKEDALRKDFRSPSPIPVSNPLPAAARAPLAEAPKPEAPRGVGDSKGSKLIVGPDIKLKGAEITDCDTLVVEGRIEATMDSRVIQIAQQGVFSGTAGIDVAEIHGSFEGELTARKQLVIHATGKVTGKIRYGKLAIEEGGAEFPRVGVDATPRVPRPAYGLWRGKFDRACRTGKTVASREDRSALRIYVRPGYVCVRTQTARAGWRHRACRRWTSGDCARCAR